MTGTSVASIMSSASMVTNVTTNNTLNEQTACSKSVPTAQQMFKSAPTPAMILLIICVVFTTLTVAIYLEEIIYTMKNFKVNRARKVKTIWILAAYPVFSVTGLLAAIVPRASLVADLVAHVFFSTCLYEFMRLTVDYCGGPQKMFELLKGAQAAFRSPPCCCCCVCLPTIPFTKSVFLKLQVVVLQVALVRPILFFLAAVLWTNGSYIPGMMKPTNAYLWVTIINLTSTMFSVYGLVVTQRACAPTLMKFNMIPKFLNYPLMLIFTIIPGIIVNVLVIQGIIPCSPLLPSKARGDRIYHAFQVFIMLPFSLFGRKLYRRAAEATMHGDSLEAVIAMMKEKKMAQMQAKNGGQPMDHKPITSGPEAMSDPPAYKIEEYIDAKTSNV